MPDGTACELDGAWGTVILSAEDGLADTIRPRLEAAGADCTLIASLTDIRDEKGCRLPTVWDLAAITEALKAVNAVLLVIDPLVAYLGGNVNSYRDQDVRSALAPLATLAERAGIAVVVIRHLNKTDGPNPLYRGGGSIGIIGAARAGLLVATDPEDEDRRVLATTKSNLSAKPASLAYRLKADAEDRLRIEWEGESDLSAGQLLCQPRGEEERSALEEACAFLRDILDGGPLASRQVKREAREAGIAERTLWRARARLGVETRKVGTSWEWALSNGRLGTDGTHDENGPVQGGSANSANSANELGDAAETTVEAGR